MSLASAMLAAGGLPPLVQDLAICLCAAVVFAVICEYLRLPHALGFIAAGLSIGPTGLALVSSPEDIRIMADLGIVMLLFLIGVELDFEALVRRGRALLIAGALQVPLTIGAALVLWLAVASLVGWSISATEALYLAMACAFSSTLLVVKSLEGRGRMHGIFGTLCIGLLLAQDLWALIILALQPAPSADLATLAAPLVGTAVVALLAFEPGRRIIGGLVARFHRSPELLGLTAVGWCLVCALVAGSLEDLTRSASSPIPLSSGAGMGAFVAGVTLASLPKAREIVHRLIGLRDFLIVFFFVSLGMAIPWPIDTSHLVVATFLVALIALMRVAVAAPLLRLGGTRRPMAAAVAAQMAQLSELGLVIAYVGHDLGHISTEVITVVVLGFVLTSALMPWLDTLASRLSHAEATS